MIIPVIIICCFPPFHTRGEVRFCSWQNNGFFGAEFGEMRDRPFEWQNCHFFNHKHNREPGAVLRLGRQARLETAAGSTVF
jgi:hypothetical protein